MKLRRVAQFLLLSIPLCVAGYAVSSHVQAAQALGASGSASVGAVVNDSQNIEDEYAGLPKMVARATQSIVAVQRITSSAPKDNAVVASGVILNDHQVLTAGHAASTNGGVLSCSDTTVDAPGFLTRAAASSNQVTYASALHSNATDLAVLAVKADQNYRSLPQIALASTLPKTGDTVYFINFQPQADGTIRDPLSKAAGMPVVFSATVVGRDNQGLQIAAGGGTSYGLGQPETLLRKGASGGAVVNGNGELVGLSVSSQSLLASRTPAYIGTNYGVTVPQGLYQIVNAQTVDMQLLTQLQSSLSSCL